MIPSHLSQIGSPILSQAVRRQGEGTGRQLAKEKQLQERLERMAELWPLIHALQRSALAQWERNFCAQLALAAMPPTAAQRQKFCAIATKIEPGLVRAIEKAIAPGAGARPALPDTNTEEPTARPERAGATPPPEQLTAKSAGGARGVCVSAANNILPRPTDY